MGYTVDGSQEEIEIPTKDLLCLGGSVCFHSQRNGRPCLESSKEKKHTDTEVTLIRAQVSAEYDVTDSVFLGGGFFYSQWKDMPVLSDTDALGIKTQDLVASGVNVEVGVRF